MKKTNNNEKDYLPCPYCLGYYAPKQLWRHKKKCIERPSTSSIPSKMFPTQHLKHYPELREKVFPKMRYDKISLTAQKDVLICAFGARYLKSHRDQRFINVVSGKMRELARLFIEVKKENGHINNFFQMLDPKYYDLMVEATKKVAEYDTEKELYGRPTYALNIGTSLKQCCDVAIDFAVKRKEIYATIPGAEARSNLQTLQQLISSNWKYDIATEASKNLNVKRWNKVTIVPLASDLKLLKVYLTDIAEKAKANLAQNKAQHSYKDLLESVYCRVILLNRKRPGELQRLKISAYEQTDSSQNYEEFCDAISPTEKILLKSFKRVVIQGKRNRGVPVLFSPDIQNDIECLLEYRKDVVPSTNPYLFCQLKNDSHIYGYKVLQKHAKGSGCKNPQALTSTRLRKHLATLSQIFNMTDNDLEQLATFMGHTTGVHRKSYRLPDDIYQTAKISKLLLLMEQGSSARYKGKSLDEIEIDLNEALEEHDDTPGSDIYEEEEVIENDNVASTSRVNHVTEQNPTTNRILHKKKKKCIKRIPWTIQQKEIVKEYFKSHITEKKPPKRHECEKLISMHENLLENKDWLKIKVFVQNMYDKKYKT